MHPGHDLAAAAAFQAPLLEEVGGARAAPRQPGDDEARFGLHTEPRRVWMTKGVRPGSPAQKQM